jgi:hypothetical protein
VAKNSCRLIRIECDDLKKFLSSHGQFSIVLLANLAERLVEKDESGKTMAVEGVS